MDYKELAEAFLYKSYEMKKMSHQQVLDESLQGEIFTLLYLQDREGFVVPSEIGAEMNVSSARVTSILNSLEKKDLIQRQIDRTDRRRILVTLTAKGQDRARKHYDKVIGIITKMLQALGEKDAREFVRITTRIVDLASSQEGNEVCAVWC